MRSSPVGRGLPRAGFSALLALCLLGAGAGASAGAQEPGILAGRVLAQEGLAPLPGARVILQETGERVTTDAAGVFHFSAVPSGPVLVRIEHDGYISLVESVPISPLETTLMQFQLLRLGMLLDALVVVAEARPDEPGRGHTEAQISGGDDAARTATDLLARSVPGLTLARSGGSMDGGARVRLRGVSSITLTDQPSVYLDGVRIDDGGMGRALRALDQIPAGEVRRIRILRGPAAAFAYPNAAAGVILVETIRSRSPARRR